MNNGVIVFHCRKQFYFGLFLQKMQLSNRVFNQYMFCGGFELQTFQPESIGQQYFSWDRSLRQNLWGSLQSKNIKKRLIVLNETRRLMYGLFPSLTGNGSTLALPLAEDIAVFIFNTFETTKGAVAQVLASIQTPSGQREFDRRANDLQKRLISIHDKENRVDKKPRSKAAKQKIQDSAEGFLERGNTDEAIRMYKQWCEYDFKGAMLGMLDSYCLACDALRADGDRDGEIGLLDEGKAFAMKALEAHHDLDVFVDLSEILWRKRELDPASEEEMDLLRRCLMYVSGYMFDVGRSIMLRQAESMMMATQRLATFLDENGDSVSANRVSSRFSWLKTALKGACVNTFPSLYVKNVIRCERKAKLKRNLKMVKREVELDSEPPAKRRRIQIQTESTTESATRRSISISMDVDESDGAPFELELEEES